MASRQLTGPPRMLPLYVRTLTPLLPGASRLSWVAGGARKVPDLQLTLADFRPDLRRLADYCHVCSLPSREHLPATYPHVLAFPLQLALMTDGRFPFGPVGLVHVANRITQHRRIPRDERLTLQVHATQLADHPRGRTFSLLTRAHLAGEAVWEEQSTMLHRGPGNGSATPHEEQPEAAPPTLSAEWRLPADLGRRYAAVSGDRNPIHMHPLAARAFGFPRAIAHGMWTKARCLAALERRLPESFEVDVRFRRPILLPATVSFSKAVEQDGISFRVHDPGGETRHLDGRVTPAAVPAADHDEEQ